ncbi:unnamed protein product [Allacma fusca]|uniref:Fanconi-associated nuclease n=1 Tax=Allacma fusca TaxID=39272 RepID=A0A8J2LBS0_9HEXA|nr:unnamed protein product [Allacma fusca]
MLAFIEHRQESTYFQRKWKVTVCCGVSKSVIVSKNKLPGRIVTDELVWSLDCSLTDSSQKKITSFFKKSNDETPGNGGGGKQYFKADESSVTATHTRVPVFVQPFKPWLTGGVGSSGEDERPAGDENLLVKCEGEDLTTRRSTTDDGGDKNLIRNSSVESKLLEVDDEGDSNEGLIRLVNFKAILEDSQSSQEDSCCETQLCSLEGTQVRGPSIPKYGGSSSFVDLVDSESSSSSVMNILKSPTRSQNSASSGPSHSFVTRTPPTKSPKSKVNHFSPVRQLSFSSKSKSKTPVKSPRILFKNPPTHNQVMNSPLKALWSQQDPYYLKNFLTVLDTVLEDKHHSHLLNTDDLEIVQKFRSLTKPAKCLYVRLAGRSWKWLRVSSVNYKEISEDLAPVFEELHHAKLVSEVKEERVPLEDLLDMLPHEKLPDICKQLNVKVPYNAKTKEKCITALMKTSRQQSTLKGSLADIIYSKALEEVGATYKLTAESRELFQRIFILYSPPQYWEQATDKDTLQLLSILLTEIGKVEYPNYKIIKTQRIYNDRKELLQFQQAWILFSQVTAFTESKQWTEVVNVAEQALETLQKLLKEPEVVSFNRRLPCYLRAYVAGSLFAKICWIGVEGLQKLKKYTLANDYLNFLLSQDLYLCHYYGRWYERLVLNSTHLKVPLTEVKALIEKALADPNVRDNHKLDLFTRLNKLKTRECAKRKPKRKPKRKKPRRKNKKDDEDWVESSGDSSEESLDSDFEIECMTLDSDNDNSEGSFIIRYSVPERTIEGEKMPTYDRLYGKSVFLDSDGSIGGAKSLSSVERFALQFYSGQGYIHGVHAEAFPLDLFSEDFRIRRRSAIDERLGKIKNLWSVDDTLELMEKHWAENFNRLSIVNWSIFNDFSHLKTLVSSLGLPLLAGICDRLAENYRYYRSGFPDLIVWDGHKCRIAEVKGPGDKLSAKQRLWIDYLLSLEADVEVCLVKSVSNKRIRS